MLHTLGKRKDALAVGGALLDLNLDVEMDWAAVGALACSYGNIVVIRFVILRS